MMKILRLTSLLGLLALLLGAGCYAYGPAHPRYYAHRGYYGPYYRGHAPYRGYYGPGYRRGYYAPAYPTYVAPPPPAVRVQPAPPPGYRPY